MANNILELLKTKCHFSQVFEEKDCPEGCWDDIPCKKIGHIRADHDGYRWWNTVWPGHTELATKEISAEIDRVYVALTAEDALKDLPTLARFCQAHPEACEDRQFQDSYNFFLDGEYCDFWIRLITRERDYNLYLNAFIKS